MQDTEMRLEQCKPCLLSVLCLSWWPRLFQWKNKASSLERRRWRKWIDVSQLNRGCDQSSRYGSYLIGWPWQQSTLHLFTIVFEFGLVNCVCLGNVKNLPVLAVCNVPIFYRLNISCIASYHSNGTHNSSQTLSIPSIEPKTCRLAKTWLICGRKTSK